MKMCESKYRSKLYMDHGRETTQTSFILMYEKATFISYHSYTECIFFFVQEAASRWKNVQAITAYMPEAFGTHHSKMLILIRHDDLAQYVEICPSIVD